MTAGIELQIVEIAGEPSKKPLMFSLYWMWLVIRSKLISNKQDGKA
jgi:hypothetical protein